MPADSTAVFRIGIGLLITYSALRFLANGWVETLYLAPDHHLTYPGFDWIKPLPWFWMYTTVVVMAVAGLAIAAGFHHRLAAFGFLATFTYTELIEATLYLNHYWFLTLAAVLLLLLPVHHHWSADALAGRVTANKTVAAWVVLAIRAQLAVVYLFAGVAKLNTDWLLRAQPLQLWFADRAGVPLLGDLLAQPVTAYVAAWAGAVFDLTIVGWLLWRRTRMPAYLVLVGFHLITGALFQIGVFPFVMIVATLIFFEPDWPRRWLSTGRQLDDEPRTPAGVRPMVAVALLGFAAVQVMLPLRHYAYPGNVRWTEEGYHLSWRVMLTDKAGMADYLVTDPATGRTWQVDPDLVLTDWQESEAANRPDLIHATAQLIADYYHNTGIPDVEVRADSWVSMNAGPNGRLIDPAVDLAAEPRTFRPAPWILPRPATGP